MLNHNKELCWFSFSDPNLFDIGCGLKCDPCPKFEYQSGSSTPQTKRGTSNVYLTYNCVVFLGELLYFHSAPQNPVYMGTGTLLGKPDEMLGSDLAMD